MIVVEKSGHGGMTIGVQSILRRHLPEVWNAVRIVPLVDIQKVLPSFGIFIDGGAYIEIGPAIVIDIHDGYPLAPFSGPVHTGRRRYIFKPETSLVQVQLIGDQVAREINIG
jgi:hypothetical protein